MDKLLRYALLDKQRNLYFSAKYIGNVWTERPRLFSTLGGLSASISRLSPSQLNPEWYESYIEEHPRPEQVQGAPWSVELNIWHQHMRNAFNQFKSGKPKLMWLGNRYKLKTYTFEYKETEE